MSTMFSDSQLFYAHADAPKTRLSGTITAAGDTIVIPAPGVGKQISYSALRVQSASADDVIVLVKEGAADANPGTIVTPTKGDGLSEVYPPGAFPRLPENTPLILNVSGVSSTRWSVRYFIISSTTGYPA